MDSFSLETRYYPIIYYILGVTEFYDGLTIRFF